MSGAEEEWDEETKARVSAAEAADGQALVRGRWRSPDIEAMLSEDERKDTAPASAGERCKVTIQQYRLKWSLDVPKNTDMSTVKRTMASTDKLPFKGRLDDAARIIFYTDASLNTRVADDVAIQEDTVVEMRLDGARKRRATAPASAGEEDNAPLAPAQCKAKAKSKPKAKPDEGEAEVDAEAAQEGERVKRVRAGKAAKMAASAPASAGTDDPPAALWTDTFNRMKEKMRIDSDFELSCAHTLSEFITSELKHFEHTKAPAELVQQNNEDLKLLQGLISSYEKVKGAETAPASAGQDQAAPAETAPASAGQDQAMESNDTTTWLAKLNATRMNLYKRRNRHKDDVAVVAELSKQIDIISGQIAAARAMQRANFVDTQMAERNKLVELYKQTRRQLDSVIDNAMGLHEQALAELQKPDE